MRHWITEILALKDNEAILFHGPIVPGISKAHAEKYCEENGLGYCTVTLECTAEIPCDENFAAKWELAKFYNQELLN